MDLYLPPASHLFYGPPGGGKTALAASSFWDFQEERMIGKGKIITVGTEYNAGLNIPDECRRTDNGTSLELISPMLDDTEFLTQFDLLTRKFVYDAQNGERLDALVFDGLSEFDLMYEYTFKQEDDERESKFAKWEGLMAEVFRCLTRLNPRTLGCQVFSTARVMERKKAVQSKQGGSTQSNEVGWHDFDYYPSMRGSFKHQLGHYFQNVFYVETVPASLPDGTTIAAHAVHTLMAGDYLTKCQWEHKWQHAGLASPVINAQWPKLWQMLTHPEEFVTQEETQGDN
jgi:hypothetical protein